MSGLFDEAVKAVTDGDADRLRSLLSTDPFLTEQRSASEHRAMLLHYVAANGVEDELQKSPPNAAEIARILLDAVADSYGGGRANTTLTLLVSSSHPHNAGVQTQLVKVLVDPGGERVRA